VEIIMLNFSTLDEYPPIQRIETYDFFSAFKWREYFRMTLESNEDDNNPRKHSDPSLPLISPSTNPCLLRSTVPRYEKKELLLLSPFSTAPPYSPGIITFFQEEENDKGEGDDSDAEKRKYDQR
jgi:hypothetical protein